MLLISFEVLESFDMGSASETTAGNSWAPDSVDSDAPQGLRSPDPGRQEAGRGETGHPGQVANS